MKQLVFAGLGVELGSLILVSVWLGPKLDQYFKTQGIMFILVLFLVLIGWFIRVLFLLKKIEKNEK